MYEATAYKSISVLVCHLPFEPAESLAVGVGFHLQLMHVLLLTCNSASSSRSTFEPSSRSISQVSELHDQVASHKQELAAVVAAAAAKDKENERLWQQVKQVGSRCPSLSPWRYSRTSRWER